MTKKQLIERMADYPEESEIGLMYNGGDTCGLEFMAVVYRDGTKDTTIIALEPSHPCSIDNTENIEALDNFINSFTKGK